MSERAEFEKWYNKFTSDNYGVSYYLKVSGKYCFDDIEFAWQAWQAARSGGASPNGWDKVGYEYQHEDTGQTGYIDEQQVEWGFFKNNPRLQCIGAIYRPRSGQQGQK